MEAIKGAGEIVHRLLMPCVRAAGEIVNHTRPEQTRGLIGVDVENLPLTGELAQEGGCDKRRDTLATKAAADEQVADVVLGAGKMLANFELLRKISLD